LSRAREITAFVLLLLVWGIAGMKEPRFLQPSNLNSVLLWMPLITVVAMGQMLVIVIRGIDVSVGSIIGFSGIVLGMVLRASPHAPVPLLLLVGLAVGVLWGIVNGVLVAYAKIAPVIVTIGGLSAIRGAAFILSQGKQVDSTVIPDSLTALAQGGIHLGPVLVSWLLVIALVVATLTAGFLHWTRLGRNIFALGSNPSAAHLRGILVPRTTLICFAASGAVAGLAGVLYAARFGFVNPGTAGQGFELNVIAAVAIGGVQMSGGRGSVLGVLLGCLLLSTINVALSVLGIDANWQLLTYGLIILIALLADALISRRRPA